MRLRLPSFRLIAPERRGRSPAVRAISDGRIADARLLYARALRCLRAAGDRADARAIHLDIRLILDIALDRDPF